MKTRTRYGVSCSRCGKGNDCIDLWEGEEFSGNDICQYCYLGFMDRLEPMFTYTCHRCDNYLFQGQSIYQEVHMGQKYCSWSCLQADMEDFFGVSPDDMEVFK